MLTFRFPKLHQLQLYSIIVNFSIGCKKTKGYSFFETQCSSSLVYTSLVFTCICQLGLFTPVCDYYRIVAIVLIDAVTISINLIFSYSRYISYIAHLYRLFILQFFCHKLIYSQHNIVLITARFQLWVGKYSRV